MKTVVQIALTAIVAYVLQLFLPWWVIILAAILVAAVLKNTAWVSFIAGFVGIALLWGVLSYYSDHSNASIMSERVSAVFSLSSGTMLIFVSTIIGGVCGGLGSLTGTFLRDLI